MFLYSNFANTLEGVFLIQTGRRFHKSSASHSILNTLGTTSKYFSINNLILMQDVDVGLTITKT